MSKHVSHMIHPGQVNENLYPMASNELTKEKRSALFYQRSIYAWNATQFGSVVNIQLSNDGTLVGDMMLSATFPAGTLRNLPMVRLINRIEVIYGGAMPYSLNINDIWSYLVDCCQSKEQKETLIEYAGGNGGVIANSTTYYLPLGHLVNSKFGPAFKYPLDQALVGGSIKIYIYLNPVATVYSSGTPAQLDAGKLYVRQAVLQNPEDKLHLKENEAVNYPFSFLQSYVSPSFTAPNTSTKVSQYLLGFRNGQCTQILLRLVEQATQYTSSNIAQMSNVVVSLNGQILYKYDDNADRVLSLFNNKCATNYVIGSTTNWYLSIPIAQTPSKNRNFSLQHEGGLNLANQQVLVEFFSSSTNACVLEATYIYNANLVCANNQCEIIV